LPDSIRVALGYAPFLVPRKRTHGHASVTPFCHQSAYVMMGLSHSANNFVLAQFQPGSRWPRRWVSFVPTFRSPPTN